MAETPDDVWLPAREQGGDRESAMRAYLAWEIDLVNQMATDDDHRFKVAKVLGQMRERRPALAPVNLAWLARSSSSRTSINIGIGSASLALVASANAAHMRRPQLLEQERDRSQGG
jgi:hypothetical protein